MNNEQTKKNNVLFKARRAASNGKKYQTKSPNLVDVAAAAYAAKVEAYSARQAADEAKKDAADARAIGIENRKRIIALEGEVIAGKKALNETAARANRNERRLNTDDRKGGYMTPPRRYMITSDGNNTSEASEIVFFSSAAHA